MDLKNHTIVIIGLGYVGLPLAVEFGKTRSVVGFDIKGERITELRAGLDSTFEVTEQELREAKHLRLTSDVSSLRRSRGDDEGDAAAPIVFIVTVPTPVDRGNRPDLSALSSATETIGRLLRAGDVVIYESTVYPGCTEEVCVPILERESGLKCLTEDAVDTPIDGFYCGYSPERVNPGDKSHRLRHIKKVTSGSTPKVTSGIDDLYREIITAGTHCASSIRVAEAAKVIENTQRDLNIAFVNELSVIFNRMGIDTSEVLEAAATKWNFLPFKPGLVGGHCIGVDPYYLTFKAEELGYRPQVILSGRSINDNMGRYAARNVIRLMTKNGVNIVNATVGVLGVTFKENCPDVRNSKVIDIIRELQRWGIKVKVMDPWADAREVQQEYCLSLTQLTSQTPVDSLIVAVSHAQFAQLKPRDLKKLCFEHEKPVIADLKAMYNLKELEMQGFEVFRF